jgi:hypothetical protein
MSLTESLGGVLDVIACHVRIGMCGEVLGIVLLGWYFSV